jgi:hypothetical protein
MLSTVSFAVVTATAISIDSDDGAIDPDLNDSPSEDVYHRGNEIVNRTISCRSWKSDTRMTTPRITTATLAVVVVVVVFGLDLYFLLSLDSAVMMFGQSSCCCRRCCEYVVVARQ